MLRIFAKISIVQQVILSPVLFPTFIINSNRPSSCRCEEHIYFQNNVWDGLSVELLKIFRSFLVQTRQQ